LVELGHGDTLKNFRLYNGSPGNDTTLADTVGWLGEDYKPKYNPYSGKDGKQTNMPKD